MEHGRWDVAIRRRAVETGGEAERRGRRGITAESGAAGREGIVGVCKGTRASAACVANPIPSSLFFIPFFLCSANRPCLIYFLCLLPFSRLVAGHKRSACARHETCINACLTFWGLSPKSWRFMQLNTHSRDIRYAHVRLFRNSLLISIMHFLFTWARCISSTWWHESWIDIYPPTISMFTLKKDSNSNKPKRIVILYDFFFWKKTQIF